MQYLFLMELAKHFKIDIVEHPFIQDHFDIANDGLIYNNSDLALCTSWMSTAGLYEKFDMSCYFDFQCGTFLVTRPTLINAAAYIFLALSGPIWIGIFISLSITIVFLTYTSRLSQVIKIKQKINIEHNLSTNRNYDTFSRSFLDTVRVITSHGITRFPNHVSIKWILMR